MEKKKILLIDDDEVLLELLSDHIRQANYEPIVAADGDSGINLVIKQEPDLVILDVMMPNMDGWEVCQGIRERSNVPIIMLTAKGGEIDKLRGFQLGVDDYVTKPFSFAELTARVAAVLSRVRRESRIDQKISSGDLEIDFDSKKTLLSGKVVDLTPTEYRLLAVLARNFSRTIPAEKLLSEVWGPEYQGESEHVKHYIWSLRKKLEADPGDPQHILTERGFGYRFE